MEGCICLAVEVDIKKKNRSPELLTAPLSAQLGCQWKCPASLYKPVHIQM